MVKGVLVTGSSGDGGDSGISGGGGDCGSSPGIGGALTQYPFTETAFYLLPMFEIPICILGTKP